MFIRKMIVLLFAITILSISLSGCVSPSPTPSVSPTSSQISVSPTLSPTVTPSPSTIWTSPSPSHSVILPQGTDLVFETVDKNISPGVKGPDVSQIRVITSKPETLISGITQEDQSRIDVVDFSKYFLIIAFHGSTYAGPLPPEKRGITIMRVWQRENIIYVLAQFQLPQSPVNPATIWPYHIIQVNRSSLLGGGKNTFILLDQLGQERDKEAYEVFHQ